MYGSWINYSEVFENVTENKLIYTNIFSEYTNLIGTNFTQHLVMKWH